MNGKKLALACSTVLLTLLSPGTARAGKVELISRAAPGGVPKAAGEADGALISADGLWIAFASSAPDLVPGQSDGNSGKDVFLRSRTTGALTLVSHAAGLPAQAGNGESLAPGAISADGRYVAYLSRASNLIAGQISFFDLFLWDRTTDTTVLVSHAPGFPAFGLGAAAISGMSDDGRYVAFLSGTVFLVSGGTDNNGANDLFLWDRTTGDVTLVSHAAGAPATAGNGETFQGSLSGDGRWAAFSSASSDLISGGTDGNGQPDAFLWDRTTGTVSLLSHVAGNNTTALPGGAGFPVISRDGGWIAFADGRNGGAGWDLSLLERATGTLTLITHAPGAPATPAGGMPASPTASLSLGLALSDDGSWVAFGNQSTGLVSGQADVNGGSDVFVWERATGSNTLVSHNTAGATTTGNGASRLDRLSSAGGRAAFRSLATNLVAGADTNGTDDAFFWERAGGAVTLMSHTPASPGVTGNGQSTAETMSADGNFAVFASLASNLAAADSNGGGDVFLWDRAAGASTGISLSPAAVSSTPDRGVEFPGPHMLSADGRFAVYLSKSDPGGKANVYLVDRSTGATTLVSHRAGSPATAGNGDAQAAVISADGRWVAFSSGATDLISGFHPAPGAVAEVFLWDRVFGSTVLVSHVPGSPASGSCFFCVHLSMSADGQYITYQDFSLFLYGRFAGESAPINPGNVFDSTISADGRFVAFLSDFSLPGQTGPQGMNVYLYDRAAVTTTLVSHPAGSPTQRSATGCSSFHPEVSADGRFIAYQCEAADLVAGQIDGNNDRDIFLYDRLSATSTLVSHAWGGFPTTSAGRASYIPLISADGRWIAFSSEATDLMPIGDSNGRPDAFLFDRVSGGTFLLSQRAAPGPVQTSAGASFAMALSADGHTMAVLNDAGDLITGISDLNGTDDLFLVEPKIENGIENRTVELVSHSLAGPAVTGNGRAYAFPSLSDDGLVVLFPSSSSDLAAGDHNIALDVFAYVRNMAYYTLTPCRLFDSRQPQDGPALVSGSAVRLQTRGSCGIPETVRGLSLNLTVTGATGTGFLTLFPGGNATPGTSTINFTAGATRANNAVLPLGADGTLGLLPFVTGNGTVHAILDVTGYFQ